MRSALADVPGVAQVSVDFDSKTATCDVDTDQFDGQVAIKALADAGFSDSSLK